MKIVVMVVAALCLTVMIQPAQAMTVQECKEFSAIVMTLQEVRYRENLSKDQLSTRINPNRRPAMEGVIEMLYRTPPKPDNVPLDKFIQDVGNQVFEGCLKTGDT